MIRLIKIFGTALIILTCAAWSQRDQACRNCETIDQVLQKVTETQKAFNKSQEDMKKNNIEFGPTEERKAFELAQGEAYQVVCADGKTSLNPIEKKAMTEFVFAINSLKIESDSVHDMNSCFFRRVMHSKSDYSQAAEDLKLSKDLTEFLKKNQPRYQDVR